MNIIAAVSGIHQAPGPRALVHLPLPRKTRVEIGLQCLCGAHRALLPTCSRRHRRLRLRGWGAVLSCSTCTVATTAWKALRHETFLVRCTIPVTAAAVRKTLRRKDFLAVRQREARTPLLYGWWYQSHRAPSVSRLSYSGGSDIELHAFIDEMNAEHVDELRQMPWCRAQQTGWTGLLNSSAPPSSSKLTTRESLFKRSSARPLTSAALLSTVRASLAERARSYDVLH